MFSKEEKFSRVGNFQLILKYRLMQENLSKWRGSKIDKDLTKAIAIYYFYKVLQSLSQTQKAQKIGKKIEFEICYLSVSKSKSECFNRSAFDINRESNYLKTFNCPKLRGKTSKYILSFHDEISQNVPFFQSYLKGKPYLKAHLQSFAWWK